ncbi:MAG TPA: SUF system NifU family Fe-S cluster assembly protein [Bdellovibrionales bacterium]|nr:SUF system NifU family Fe-S cluster assembly protein [Bdellovibrionales bacterium]
MTGDAMAELYQQMILEHNKKPRNFGKLPDATHQAEGFNPLCGDHYTVYLKLEGGVVKSVYFEGAGCAISKASASMMTAALQGKTADEAKALFEDFHSLLTGKSEAADRLGKLKIFSGIWKYPSRVKCASLSWHAMKSALVGGQTVTTE